MNSYNIPDDAINVLSSGNVFFDYGPVSMAVTAIKNGLGDTELCKSAFGTIVKALGDLRPHLEKLRTYPRDLDPTGLTGIAKIMADSVFATGDELLTPMAAVAGTVSDTVADYLQSQGAEKVFANNGGDIALRLNKGESLTLGLLPSLENPDIERKVTIKAEYGIGGVATSGLGGRSLTTGIADCVSVFSPRCTLADALATSLADKSYINSKAVHRKKAFELDPSSDIADLDVVVKVDELSEEEKTKALKQVMDEAKIQYEKGNLIACYCSIQGKIEVFDPLGFLTK